MRREEKVGIEVEHAALAEAHAAASVCLAAIRADHGQHVVEDSWTLEVEAEEGSVRGLEEEVAEEGEEHGDGEQCDGECQLQNRHFQGK